MSSGPIYLGFYVLDVLVASTDPDFATTGDVLMLTYGSTTTDTVESTQMIDHLGRMVRRSSAWAQSFVGVPGPLATYRETVAGFGDPYLRLTATPIRAVLAVYDATDTGQATDITADVRLANRDAGLLARNQGFPWSIVQRSIGGDFSLGLTGALIPNTEAAPWLVDYVAGYVPLGGLSTDSLNYSTGLGGSTSTGSTIPEEVRHGVALRTLEVSVNPTGVLSRRVADLSVQYATAGPASSGSGAEAWLQPFAARVA